MHETTIHRFELRCPSCQGQINLDASAAVCLKCTAPFPSLQGVPCLLSDTERQVVLHDLQSDGENAFKNWFKRWPRAYKWAVNTCTPLLYNGVTVKRFLARFPSGSGLRMLNVGSGATRLHPDVVNLDIYPFPNVDVVATATRLPFATDAFDVVVTEEVIEHVSDPFHMARELLRVVKPGGLVYLGGPFIYPFHPSPRDYTRWTYDGLLAILSPGIEVERGITAGPTSGLLSLLAMWLAIVFSLGARPVRKAFFFVFMVLLSPLKLADVVLARVPGAEDAAHAFYVVVRKPERYQA